MSLNKMTEADDADEQELHIPETNGGKEGVELRFDCNTSLQCGNVLAGKLELEYEYYQTVKETFGGVLSNEEYDSIIKRLEEICEQSEKNRNFQVLGLWVVLAGLVMVALYFFQVLQAAFLGLAALCVVSGTLMAWQGGKMTSRSYLAACGQVRNEVQRLNAEGNQGMSWELEEHHKVHRGVEYVDQMSLWGRSK